MIALWTLVTNIAANVLAAAQSFFSKVPVAQAIGPQKQRNEFSIEVVRPDDLLVAQLVFFNLRREPASGSTPARIRRDGPGNGFIIAHLPPQSFAERAFFEAAPGSSGTEPLGASPVPSRIGGPSKLVFRIPDALLPLDYSLDAILDALAQSSQVVQNTIQQPIRTPDEGSEANFGGADSQFTAVEAPYRLVLSPNAASRWEHAFKPASDSAGKRTELWHTRLSAGAKSWCGLVAGLRRRGRARVRHAPVSDVAHEN
jgi:hypothetical protein